MGEVFMKPNRKPINNRKAFCAKIENFRFTFRSSSAILKLSRKS